MSEFPTTLPTPLLGQFLSKTLPNVRATPVQVGPPRRERIAVVRPKLISVTWVFNREQAVVFRDWYVVGIKQGSMSFEIPLPTGTGMETHLCFFNNPFTYSRVGANVHIQAQLITARSTSQAECTYLLLCFAAAATDTSCFLEAFTTLVADTIPTELGDITCQYLFKCFAGPNDPACFLEDFNVFAQNGIPDAVGDYNPQVECLELLLCFADGAVDKPCFLEDFTALVSDTIPGELEGVEDVLADVGVDWDATSEQTECLRLLLCFAGENYAPCFLESFTTLVSVTIPEELG